MMIFEITLILLHCVLSASAAQQHYPSSVISKNCHLYSLSNKDKQFILFADRSRKFSKRKPQGNMNGNTNYMFTIVNGKSMYDKQGNLVYSTVRLIDTKSNRTLCQTRSNRRRPVFKKTRYWRKFPRKCQYREFSKVIPRGEHEYNYHLVNDAFKNYLQWRNFNVRYSSKRVMKMRRKMNFVPDISFHKDCEHPRITSVDLERGEQLGKRRKKFPEGRREVRINNKSRKKRNPYRRIRSPAQRVRQNRKAVDLNHRRSGKDDT